MRRVRNTALVTCTTVSLCLMLGGPALAADGWGHVKCGDAETASCDVEAGRDGTKATPPQGKPLPQIHPPDTDGKTFPGDRLSPDDSRLAHCSYVRSDYQPPADGATTIDFRARAMRSGRVQLTSLAVPHFATVGAALDPTKSGAWYVYRCSGQGVRDGLYRAPVWIPDGPAPALPSPEQLAQQARSQLRLPAPPIRSNPAGVQLVGLPTWLWLDQASWGPRSATASVPGVSVTAVATPTAVSWSMGDGTTLTCIGPGTPFPHGGDPLAASPDCGHIYRQASAAMPDKAFAASATAHWSVTWSGAGTGGTFPDLTTTASTAFPVAEVQALGTGNP